MEFLFKSKTKEKTTVVIFDIGSGNIGGAIVELPIKKGELPTIIKSAHEDISSSNDFDLLFKNTLRALEKTAQSLNKNNTVPVTEVICVLASPWYLSETRVAKMSREYPFVFSQRQANELLQKEISNLSETYKNKYGESDTPEIIDSLVMGVSLNGLPVNDPIGKKCKTVDLNILASLSSGFFLNKIRESVLKNFHHIPISFSSFISSSYIAVRDRYISPNSYILVDVGGEVTDVSIVKNGILKQITSFPQGKKTFFRYIAQSKNIELRDAEELFNLYTSRNLSSSLTIKSHYLFNSIENKWSDSFKKCFDNLPTNIVTPEVVFLTADTVLKKWLVEMIQREEFIKIKTGKSFNIVTLDGPQFLDMCNVKNNSCDPFLMIEAISVMRKKEK